MLYKTLRKYLHEVQFLDSLRDSNCQHRTAEEEEGIRASEAIDRILSRLSNSDVVVKGKQPAVPS